MKKLLVPVTSPTVVSDAPEQEISLESLLARLKELDDQKDAVKQYYADLDAILEAIAQKSGVNVSHENLYLQLSDNDDVFEIGKFKGKFTHAPDYEYRRTARDGEPSQGKLARKTALELGFTLPEKRSK